MARRLITQVSRSQFVDLCHDLVALSSVEAIQSFVHGLADGENKKNRVRWRQLQALLGVEQQHPGFLRDLDNDVRWSMLYVWDMGNGAIYYSAVAPRIGNNG